MAVVAAFSSRATVAYEIDMQSLGVAFLLQKTNGQTDRQMGRQTKALHFQARLHIATKLQAGFA